MTARDPERPLFANAKVTPRSREASQNGRSRVGSGQVRFVRRLVAERRIRHAKVGRYIRFDRQDLDAFLAAGVREPVER
ncbi:helix-turn-helix domain-containing protein [Quadrisphaera sp. DSM 44207]|uniref:helix-turn-helix domain-containing protein n=1 Tax=Quadrisphaera sp. DSM 44207 TaxID=1881057 RepID=UPI000885341F|nr:helix-turn-helix domain-containing protein [Quadrisphaera sp. DSM 44207]SDQ05707.1 DNA binding domain-containing protein, excisionase family [Quadrisphaera sp. DSM 44207]